MVRSRLVPAILVFLALLTAALIHQGTARAVTGKSSVGIYLYENIEGFHTVSSTANTLFAASLEPAFARITTCDRVPLESNETVRILEEMTEDRKVVVTTLTAWAAGGVISAPTVTFADDDIKFKDLTWHVDEKALREDAGGRKLDYALTGSFSGMVKRAGGDESEPRRRLVSVTVVSNLKLIDLRDDAVVWAGSYSEVAAGFDSRVAFNEAVTMICEIAGADINKRLAE